ncbi:MAG: PEGA domain-containing protein [Calditrichia bacterium]
MQKTINLIKTTVLFCSMSIGIFAQSQQIFDDMVIEDISKSEEISRIVLLESDQAALVVKSQIPSLVITSNNSILQNTQREPGVWYLLLKPGTHRIRINAEGHNSVVHRINLKDKEVAGLKVNLVPADESISGLLSITSQPDSASVYLNDERYGSTPFLGRIRVGRYNLELRRNGYLPYKLRLLLLPGENKQMEAILERDISIVQETSANTLPADSEKGFWTGGKAILAGGGAIVLGGAAWLLLSGKDDPTTDDPVNPLPDPVFPPND